MRWDLCVPDGLWLQFCQLHKTDLSMQSCSFYCLRSNARTERLYLKQCPLTGLSFEILLRSSAHALQVAGMSGLTFGNSLQLLQLLNGLNCLRRLTRNRSDQIRSYYISSSHTRLIRWLTLTGWVHLLQTRRCLGKMFPVQEWQGRSCLQLRLDAHALQLMSALSWSIQWTLSFLVALARP